MPSWTCKLITISKTAGVMGKEGRQAVRCSDFAFARFRFLRRVLLVHGHWYYWRVSSLVQYFFYKNIAFNTPVVFFTIFSAYSTQVLSFGALSWKYLTSSFEWFTVALWWHLPYVFQPNLHGSSDSGLRHAGPKLYLSWTIQSISFVSKYIRKRFTELATIFQMDSARYSYISYDFYSNDFSNYSIRHVKLSCRIVARCCDIFWNDVRRLFWNWRNRRRSNIRFI